MVAPWVTTEAVKKAALTVGLARSGHLAAGGLVAFGCGLAEKLADPTGFEPVTSAFGERETRFLHVSAPFRKAYIIWQFQRAISLAVPRNSACFLDAYLLKLRI